MHLRLPRAASLVRFATPSATALLALSVSAGCSVKGELEVEPMVRYEGNPRNIEADYMPGQSIVVQSRMGSVNVSVGASEQIEAVFEPFTLDTEKNEEKATREMGENLKTEIVEDGGLIRVKVYREGENVSGNLGADITLRIPIDFNGGFESQMDMGDTEADFAGVDALTVTRVTSTGPGDIVLRSLTGNIDATTDLGDIDIQVIEWATSSGIISTGNGDVSISVPTAANGSITAFADGPDALVSEPSPLPATWAMAEAGPNSKSFTFGDGSGGQVDVSTGLGDIVIGAN